MDDLPVTDLVLDPATGDLYAATDFGVLKLETGSTAWLAAGPDMPMVEVADLTIDSVARKLYAATHGRADGLEAERMLTGVLAPMLNRPVDELKQKLPIGPAEECAAKLAAYARAGAQRLFIWPLADEIGQLALLKNQVAPMVEQMMRT